MTEDQESLVGSYHDNCWTKNIIKFINDPNELQRLNKWRGTNWTQEMLNEVLVGAATLRLESGLK